jgi:hypothetical protein
MTTTKLDILNARRAELGKSALKYWNQSAAKLDEAAVALARAVVPTKAKGEHTTLPSIAREPAP